MSKRFIILLLVLSVAGELYAQWTKKDSLNLQRIINGNGELKLNPEAVKRIDFGSASDSMQESKSKGWLQPDETLPKVKYTEIKECVKMCLNKIIKQNSYNSSRNASNNYLKPH